MATLKAFRRPMSLLERTDRLLKAKAIKKPVWLDTLKKFPPDLPQRYHPKPPKIEYPEDRLLKKYFTKNPSSKKHQVFNLLNQEEKPPALKFVLRQLQLMNGKEKLSEAAAYRKTCQEVRGMTGVDGHGGVPEVPGRPLVDKTRSLAEAFDEWMNAEDSFWRQRTAFVKKTSKPEKTLD